MLAMSEPTHATPEDPYLWLEDVQGERALDWVRERNAETTKLLSARTDYAPTREKLLEVLNARDRIPAVARRGAFNAFTWHAAGPIGFGRDLVLGLLPSGKLASDLDWLYGWDADAALRAMWARRPWRDG